MKKNYVTPQLTMCCFSNDVITNSTNTYVIWGSGWGSYNENLFD